MNVEHIIKLIDAGFSKDEILAMTADKTEKVEPAKEAKMEMPATETIKGDFNERPVPEIVQPEPKDEKEDPIDKAISEKIDATMDHISKSFDQFFKLAGMPSLANVQPKGVEDIVKNFFNEEV